MLKHDISIDIWISMIISLDKLLFEWLEWFFVSLVLMEKLKMLSAQDTEITISQAYIFIKVSDFLKDALAKRCFNTNMAMLSMNVSEEIA